MPHASCSTRQDSKNPYPRALTSQKTVMVRTPPKQAQLRRQQNQECPLCVEGRAYDTSGDYWDHHTDTIWGKAEIIYRVDNGCKAAVNIDSIAMIIQDKEKQYLKQYKGEQ